jgi:hypothetical protein
MAGVLTNALDVVAVLSYIEVAIPADGIALKDLEPRDAFFFYTLRLSLPLLVYGERAGETCAVEVSKTS